MFILRESRGPFIAASDAGPPGLPGYVPNRESLAGSVALADDSTSPGGDVGRDRV
jgi:hypothetical protein